MAVDMFLKLDGIEGESRDDKHKNEIDLLSFSWGAFNDSDRSGGGGGAGKVSIQDFHFTMSVSKASPQLFLHCAQGKHIATAVMTARRTGEVPLEFLKMTFSDVLITSYQTGGSSGDVVPVEQVSLNFAKVEFEYTPQDAKGGAGTPVKASWDVKASTGS